MKNDMAPARSEITKIVDGMSSGLNVIGGLLVGWDYCHLAPQFFRVADERERNDNTKLKRPRTTEHIDRQVANHGRSRYHDRLQCFIWIPSDLCSSRENVHEHPRQQQTGEVAVVHDLHSIVVGRFRSPHSVGKDEGDSRAYPEEKGHAHADSHEEAPAPENQFLHGLALLEPMGDRVQVQIVLYHYLACLSM